MECVYAITLEPMNDVNIPRVVRVFLCVCVWVYMCVRVCVCVSETCMGKKSTTVYIVYQFSGLLIKVNPMEGNLSDVQ